MIAQLARRSAAEGNATIATTPAVAIPSKASATPSIVGNHPLVVSHDDATAVSDGWMGSASPPPSAIITSVTTVGGNGGGSGGGLSSAASMPRPCSSLSLADLGDLCGDQAGDDHCGDVFLVGGDSDDVTGSGIGLDLYDLGQVCSQFCFWKIDGFGRLNPCTTGNPFWGQNDLDSV